MYGADFNKPYFRSYESSPCFRQTKKNLKDYINDCEEKNTF